MTRLALFVFLSCLALPSAVFAQPVVRSGYDIAWFDEFDGTSLDTTRWTASSNSGGGGNQSLQHYLPEMVTVAGGKLVITSNDIPTALKPYRSGLIETNNFQLYGRWDVRAKLPGTKGTWPAHWLLAAARWPSGGEIDILENRGNEPLRTVSAFHYGTNPPYAPQYKATGQSTARNGNQVNYHDGSFHTYSLEWDPEQIRFYVDDVHHWTVYDSNVNGFLTGTFNGPDGPSGVGPMKLIINTAIGGSFLPNPDFTSVWPQTHEIDYVHAYTKSASAPVLTFENGGFEDQGGSLAHWSKFGDAGFNVSTDNGQTGSEMLKLYGQFNGDTNFSGVEQGISVTAGDEIRASVDAFVAAGDSLAGTANQLEFKIDYYSKLYGQFGTSEHIGSDLIILANAGSPTNQIFNDEILSTAPAGTVEARVGIVFKQVANAGGAVYIDNVQVSYSNQPLSITDEPDSQIITVGDPVTFSVVASGAVPLTYQWQRAESGTSSFADITGATSSNYTLPNVQASDNGDQFRVIVTDAFDGTTTSSVALLTATTNLPPSATISITGGLRNDNWDAGTSVSFSGIGNDPEDGTLPASSFTWQVDYLTTIDGGDSDGDGLPGITGPFLSPGDIGQVASSSFTPATTGPYMLTDVAHVITLTVTDFEGRTGVEHLVINPNTATLTVTTNPTGLEVTVDGQPFIAPHDFDSVVGFEWPLGAAASQSFGGTNYDFVSWSDGGAATHTIATPAVNTIYTADYDPGPFGVNVNFQKFGSQGFAGYAADFGLAFGDRGNGLSYGWNIDNTANARNRNDSASADERFDTLNHFQRSGDATTWEIALANGTYNLHIVAGDPSFSDQVNDLDLEGTVVTDPDGQDNFDEYNTVVTVTDGRLTIMPAVGASNAKIAFIEITSSVPVTLGDANDDGVLDNLDITAFGLALFQPAVYAAMYPGIDPDVDLDMNDDGVFNNLDTADFGAALGF